MNINYYKKLPCGCLKILHNTFLFGHAALFLHKTRISLAQQILPPVEVATFGIYPHLEIDFLFRREMCNHNKIKSIIIQQIHKPSISSLCVNCRQSSSMEL